MNLIRTTFYRSCFFVNLLEMRQLIIDYEIFYD